MFIYAGIDEAGYGPLLGPLCVACTAFVIDEHDPRDGAPNLWRHLSKAVCRRPTDGRKRIAIEDSKKLKGAKDAKAHPLRHLERGVLSFCGASSSLPADDDELFARLNVEIVDRLPWYRSGASLPVAHSTDQLRIASSRLGRALEQHGVRCEIMACEAIDASIFNDQVQTMGTKASVNLCAVMRHVDSIWRRWPEHHPRIIVDRQGGRTHYLDDLQAAFPGARLRIIAEQESVSRYHLAREGAEMTVSFVCEAERGHLPVALASMTAKYVRELLMARLNRFFCARVPELKPTAGYFQDGRRYVAEIEPVISELGVDRRELIRVV